MPKDASHDFNSRISRRTLVRAGVGAIAAPAVLRVIAANAQSRVITGLAEAVACRECDLAVDRTELVE